MESKLNENISIWLISNSDEIKYNNNNEDSNNYLKINDSLQLYENQIDSNNNNFLGSEEIFINQKKEIDRMKKKNELINSKKETKSNLLAIQKIILFIISLLLISHLKS